MTDADASRFESFLARARDGDAAALDEILTLTEPQMRQYVGRRLGPKLRAKLRESDVLQNAYLEILRALPEFEGHGGMDGFVAWACRIVENDIQRQRRWFFAAKRAAPERTSERNTLARILLDPQPTPSREFAAGEEQELLRRALETLPADYTRVIELSVFDELPHREIAERMGRSETACRMLLCRARAALALAIEDQVDED